MSTPAPPFLTVEGRIDYLTRKNYLFGSVPTDSARERLAVINFHYLLGYARNYRALASQSLVPQDDVLTRVLAIVDADREVSVSIFHALRKLEWRLRALVVEHHCALYPPTQCFLDSKHFRVFDRDQPPLETMVEKYIRRSREPFLVDHFDNGGEIRDLPVWAVVDTWTFGGLSRVICESVPVIDPDGGPGLSLWKCVAASLGVSAPTIMEKLRAVTVLRNLVAHHGRLWMRPSSNPPKIPTIFPASTRRGVDPRSMYGVFLALSEMLGPRGDGADMLTEIDAILGRDVSYELGIKKPLAKSRQTLVTPVP